MSYKKADKILPMELVERIQSYIDGEYIYIPRKEVNKRAWGETTTTKEELARRNSNIYQDYLLGNNVHTLSEQYYLSSKSIQRIILLEKKKLS